MSKLWIRSQDKKQLKEVESLWISNVRVNNPNNYNYYDEGKLYYTIIADEEVFGRFETQERVLEVLDDIFNLLSKCNGITFTPLKEKQIKDAEDIETKKKVVLSNNDIKAFSCDVVYQIPKQ